MTQSDQNAFELSGVKVTRSGRAILDLPTLRVPAGSATALSGPNGAGKTTLLMLLALLSRPDEGKMVFFGRELDPGVPSVADRRRVTLVMQSPWLFSGTVLDNVVWGLRTRGIRGEAAASRAGGAMESLGLEDLAGRRARTLSGGEARRLAVARALVLEPDVLLLDEPTADVDEENREIIETAVLKANREKGTTVVFSSHDRDQAPRLSAAVFRLVNGRLESDEGRTRPADRGSDEGDQT